MLVAIKEMEFKIEINFTYEVSLSLSKTLKKGTSTPEASRQCDKWQLINCKK